MSTTPVDLILSLPIADRHRAMSFYRDCLGFEPLGEPTEDGVPEPLQFRLTAHTVLALIPTGGFGWVIGDREVAPPTVSECLLGLSQDSAAGVTETISRMHAAGGTILAEPEQQDWGFTGVCTDPDGHAWQITASPPPPPAGTGVVRE